ncbi:class II fructose-bisphosphate aldolase [Buchnera aphidicola]|uniref:class II fructose-bisphosphate aldolase n=1 Tax=Buchnera aphidicola TaxID=9 RepID=UPI002093C768|nr:class II fructose-bisphosphate aldolase [Buchnera aphidicola]USS94030.1 class II fructose-bisphosphate aldolase [Buchnera aphidicola (Sipha maydis)]WII23574.1 class II fructose-bisphosphate aldolase [Buchnera aphidicola (Sipha maydis)]
MKKILKNFKSGILNGKETRKIFELAKKNNFAIPSINCINTDSINMILEAAQKIKSPVIIQFSYGGSLFFSGKINKNNNFRKAIDGAISGAQHIHLMSKYYKIPIIIHTDHCDKKNLPWINGLIKYGKKYFIQKGKPLFSSHMLDLSHETLKKNIKICSKYFKKMKKINMLLEIELGCTGGEEDGIDNTTLNKKYLYTKPQEVNYAYKKLSLISKNFSIAASFGNVHGVYKVGNVDLKPKILKFSQKYVMDKNNISQKNPLNFVFHGGSGSSLKDIIKSIKYGVVKINFDTDIQWYTWKGVLNFYKKNKNYLKQQLGNPEGKNKPNKKYYDPRTWIQEYKNYVSLKLKKIFQNLNTTNLL